MEDKLTYPGLIAILKFPFKGKNWQRNFIIGSLVIFLGIFIPLIPWVFICGYALSIMKLAIYTDDLELPSWSDVAKLGIDGLRGGLISFLYTLPGSVILFGGMGLYFITSLIVPLMMEFGHWHSPVAAVLFPVTMFISIAILTISMSIGIILLLIGAFSLPLALSHLVAEDRLVAGFQVRSWFAVLRNVKWEYSITWILVSGLTVLVYTLIMLMYYSIALCCLVPWVLPPVMMYILTIYAALFGKIYGGSLTD